MAGQTNNSERIVIERLVVGQFEWKDGRSVPLWGREEVDAAQAEKIRQEIAHAKSHMQLPKVRIVGPASTIQPTVA